MRKTKTPRNEVWNSEMTTFLALTFLPAWLLFLLPVFWGEVFGAGQTVVRLIAWSLGMWIPGASALWVTRREGGKPLERLGLKTWGGGVYYLWAWIAPALLVVVAGLLTLALGLGAFDRELMVIKQSLEGLPENAVLSPRILLGIQIGAALLLAPFINTPITLGEELGWRGYLLPRLLPLGENQAILLSGVIWGLWHAPVILQGHNYPDAPWLGVGMMVVFTTLFGVFLSWLVLETGSPWAPALAHGSLNAMAGLPLLFLSDVNYTWGGTLTSAVGWIPLILLAGGLYLTGRLPTGKEPRKVSRET